MTSHTPAAVGDPAPVAAVHTAVPCVTKSDRMGAAAKAAEPTGLFAQTNRLLTAPALNRRRL